MHDALGVRCREHIEQVRQQANDLARAQATAAAPPAGLERLAFEELHHDEDGPIVGRVVVQDADRPRVSDAVRRVTFAQEAGA